MVSARGFTLIEVTLVLGIIGILTSLTLVALNVPFQLQKTRDGTRKADMRNVQLALELYRTDQGSYPALITCGNALAAGGSTYMQQVPCEKKSGWPAYSYVQVGSGYTLTACLEVSSDTDATGAVCGTNGKQYIVANL